MNSTGKQLAKALNAALANPPTVSTSLNSAIEEHRKTSTYSSAAKADTKPVATATEYRPDADVVEVVCRARLERRFSRKLNGSENACLKRLANEAASRKMKCENALAWVESFLL